MSLPDYYEAYWEDWQPRTPPPDPRGPHHHETQPHDDFVGLCDLAECVGMGVELDVSATSFTTKPSSDDQSYRYRNVVALHVRSGDPAFDSRLGVTVRFGVGDTLAKMAERARRELEAKL